MSHLRGPWHRGKNFDQCVYGSDGVIVATVAREDLDDRTWEHRARLISAAPDLLAALKALLSPDAEGDVEQAIRAIGKAEGTEAYAEEAMRIIAKIEGRQP